MVTLLLHDYHSFLKVQTHNESKYFSWVHTNHSFGHMLILIIKANEFGKKEKLLGILISNMVVFDMCKPKFKNLMQRCI